MKKSTYILIYGIIATNFFDIVPFGYLLTIARGAIFEIVELLWLVFGLYLYPFRSKNKRPHSIFLILFILSILPSFFMSKQLFGQTIIQSLITSRPLLQYLAIPVLFRIEPTPNEIIKGCYLYSIIFITICLARTFLPLQFYVVSEKQIEYMADTGDFLNRPAMFCYSMIVLPLLYYCQQIYNRFSYSYLGHLIILYLIVIANQNRSVLFPTTIFVGFALLLSKWKNKGQKIIFITILSIIAIALLINIFTSLINETTSQLASTGDPRVMAMAYFFDFDRMSWPEILFGTGNISFATSNYVEELQDAHIHYSDVGMVGFWSIYGIFATILLLFYIIKATFSKTSPLYLKAFGVTTIICSATISYFNVGVTIVWFVLLLYLYEYYKCLKENLILQTQHLSKICN